MQITLATIRLILSLIAVFLIPGWSFILITGLWRLWRPLQRWIIAIGASIAFYPILYYLTRFILPTIHIGLYKNLTILIIGIILILFFVRKNWREQFSFDRWEVITILFIGATIFTRFWIIKDLPYPAWTDSLHHSILTKLTAELGQLPFTLEPYSGTSLDMYHLGLYSISGVVQQLSGAPAYTALLWSAQIFNGLCAIGIYFVLDRFVGKWASLTGVVVAGLLSFQPAWYVNWGRFTQLSSQVIMLLAFGATWELLQYTHRDAKKISMRQAAGFVILTAGLNAAVFLIHFRVAVYYLPFLLGIVLYEVILAVKNHNLMKSLVKTLQIGGLSLFLIIPVLIPAITSYLNQKTSEGLAEFSDANFSYSFQTILGIGLHPWLFWASVLFGLIALASRHRIFAIITWLWVLLLFIEGNLYRLGIPFLNFTNFSGIMIGFYIPASILLGLGVETIAERIPTKLSSHFYQYFIYGLFIMGFVASFYRSTGIESWRFLMTDYDRQAMDWINQNTAADSVFAINTYFWLENYPIGTDGGYWIPYFTGRRTNTETMLLPTNQPEEMNLLEKRSEAIASYTSGSGDLHALCDLSINYIYSGKGNALSKAFDTQTIELNPDARLIYQNPGVMIFQLCTDKAGK
jgi:hypothetical protein